MTQTAQIKLLEEEAPIFLMLTTYIFSKKLFTLQK